MSGEVRHKRELLLKLFFAHGDAERAGDLDAVMATLSDNPKFEWHPAGYRAEGTEAVREFYRRTLPTLGKLRIGRASGNLGDLDTPVDVLWMGTDSMVTRDDLFFTDEDGVEHCLRHLSIFTLDGFRLEGETVFSTAEEGRLLKQALGEDFATLPGVTVL